MFGPLGEATYTLSAPRRARKARRGSTAVAERARVLVCDDSDMARPLVSRLLESGYQCRLAASGAEALAAAREFAPDVILAGAPAPGMDGRGLVSALRGLPELARVPVVMLAGASEQEPRAERPDAGADDYLATPVDGRALLARVRSLVRLRRVSDELDKRTRALEQSNRMLAAARRSRIRAEKLGAVRTLVAGLAHEASGSLSVLKSGVTSIAASLGELRGALRRLEAAGSEAGRADLGAACQAPLAEALAILHEMADGSARLERVTRDLRTFAWSEWAPADAVDLEAEVERAWAAIEAVNGRPRFLLEGGGDAGVVSVRHLVAEALQVVLQNAVGAAGPGGLVRVALKPQPAGVLVSVQDSGPGISPERLPCVFDPFSTAKPASAGHGMGLAGARAILGTLGGCIDAASAPGSGATFRLWVPRRPPQGLGFHGPRATGSGGQ